MRVAPGVVCLLVVAAMSGAASPARGQDTDACIDASEKAVALRKADKLLEERASLSTCAAASCPDAIRTSCQERLAQANQAIASIIFFAKDGTGRDLAAVTLTVDGAHYADQLDGSAIALDPGEHEFRFEMAGKPAVVKRFVMHLGEQNRRETILIGAVLEAAPIDGGSSALGAAAGGHRSTQRTIGLAVGGVGLASLAAGAIFGGLSMAAHASYQKDCGMNIGAPPGFCTQQGVDRQSDAAMKGTLSTAFFIAGGVAAAAGAVVFFTAPKGAAKTQVGVGMENIVVRGQF